jgi:hypothetical protein
MLEKALSIATRWAVATGGCGGSAPDRRGGIRVESWGNVLHGCATEQAEGSLV